MRTGSDTYAIDSDLRVQMYGDGFRRTMIEFCKLHMCTARSKLAGHAIEIYGASEHVILVIP